MADEQVVDPKAAVETVESVKAQLAERDQKLAELTEKAKGYDRSTTEYEELKRIPKALKDRGLTSLEDLDARLAKSASAKVATDDFLDEDQNLDMEKVLAKAEERALAKFDARQRAGAEEAAGKSLQAAVLGLPAQMLPNGEVSRQVRTAEIRGIAEELAGAEPVTAEHIKAATDRVVAEHNASVTAAMAAIEKANAEARRTETLTPGGSTGAATGPRLEIEDKLAATTNQREKKALVQAEVERLLAQGQG
jgi:hypothetical protein